MGKREMWIVEAMNYLLMDLLLMSHKIQNEPLVFLEEISKKRNYGQEKTVYVDAIIIYQIY